MIFPAITFDCPGTNDHVVDKLLPLIIANTLLSPESFGDSGTVFLHYHDCNPNSKGDSSINPPTGKNKHCVSHKIDKWCCYYNRKNSERPLNGLDISTHDCDKLS